MIVTTKTLLNVKISAFCPFYNYSGDYVVARITDWIKWGSSYCNTKKIKTKPKPQITLFPSTGWNKFHFIAPKILSPTSIAMHQYNTLCKPSTDICILKKESPSHQDTIQLYKQQESKNCTKQIHQQLGSARPFPKLGLGERKVCRGAGYCSDNSYEKSASRTPHMGR